MKKKLFVFFVICLFSQIFAKSAFSQNNNSGKKVTPHALAATIASALEELRTELQTSNFPFTSAELELSTTSTKSVGGGLSVKVVNATVDRTKETEVTIAYSLSQLLEKEQENTANIENLDKLLATINKGANGAAPKMTEDQKLKMNEMLWITAKSNETGDAGKSIMAAEGSILKFRKNRKSDYEKCKEVIVSSVKNAIQEFEELKKTYGKVCFSVSISFGLTITGEGDISLFDIVSVDGSYAKENTHSLVLFFGDCD
jgi:hypothetical protein